MLLAGAALVPYPACGVRTIRVMVSPAHGPALLAPLVHATKPDGVAGTVALHSRRHVEVVRDEQRLVRRETDDEALTTTSVGIVCEEADDGPGALDRQVAGAVLIRTPGRLVAGADRFVGRRVAPPGAGCR